MFSYIKNKVFPGKTIAKENIYLKNAIVDPTAMFYPSGLINRQNDRTKIIVGKNTRIFGHLVVFKTGKIEIGDHSLLNHGSYITSTANVKVGDRVLISWNVSIFDSNSHPIDAVQRHEHFLNPDADVDIPNAPTIIEDDVWIGCNCVVLKGVTIGKRSIISAGSVVTKSVPPDSIVAGNPAQVIKTIA